MACGGKAKVATTDAMRVGQVQTFQPQWADATLSFMKSDGYKVASRVRKITQKTLILWGREDSILDTKYASRFLEEVPDSELKWVERCGHVAHLEQPSVMRDLLFAADTDNQFLGGQAPNPQQERDIQGWLDQHA